MIDKEPSLDNQHGAGSSEGGPVEQRKNTRSHHAIMGKPGGIGNPFYRFLYFDAFLYNYCNFTDGLLP